MENSETVPFKRKHDASESQTNFNLTTNSRSERKPIPFGKLSKKTSERFWFPNRSENGQSNIWKLSMLEKSRTCVAPTKQNGPYRRRRKSRRKSL